MITNASADVVPQDEFYAAAGAVGDVTRTRDGSHTRLEVTLNLSAYSDASVTFDFGTLIGRGGDGFAVGSASGSTFIDGFRLLQPTALRRAGGDANATYRGFHQAGQNGFYSTAMFNLAQYDGQYVLLSLEFDEHSAGRRGFVNINNLSANVTTLERPTAAVIPEPATVSLLSIAFVALLATRVHATRRGDNVATALR